MNLDVFEEKLGYRFKNPALLKEALTHPSMSRESGASNYERMEFLGDSVLGLVIAELLFRKFPHEREGDMAKRKSALVSGATVGKVAANIGLAEAMRVSGSEEAAGGRRNNANLEDVCEALIGALYLDAGFEIARAFVLAHWERLSEELAKPPRDPKTTLQEWAQARGLPLPSYDVIQTQGPAHAPEFTIRVSVQGQPPEQGRGTAKRAAEQEAAKRLLEALGVEA